MLKMAKSSVNPRKEAGGTRNTGEPPEAYVRYCYVLALAG